MPAERIQVIDIAKGIAILLVIIGHQIDYFGYDWKSVYDFIYLFHVPLFFFVSGLFFKESESLWECIKKKAKRLYLPFIIANAFFFAVEMARAAYLGQQYDGSLGWKDLLMSTIGLYPVLSMLSRPTWFILILFRVFILYKLVQIVAGNNKWTMAGICLAVGTIGILYVSDTFMIGQTLSALPFFCLGDIIGAEGIRKSSIESKKTLPALVFAISIPALIIISQYQRTNMAVNVYGNILLFFAGAITGIVSMLCLSSLVRNSRHITAFFTFIGRNTLPILILHIFVMKIIYTVAGQASTPLIFITELAAAVAIPCGASHLCNFLENRYLYGKR